MRKRMIAQTLLVRPPLEQRWLDLESSASVEITSEDAAFPIESALLQQEERGWRADEPGVQTTRLIFARLANAVLRELGKEILEDRSGSLR